MIKCVLFTQQKYGLFLKKQEKSRESAEMAIFCIFAVRFQHSGVMTKYPIGLQNFQGLREDGYVYVDK
jgi:hypothetical protein